MRPRGYRMLRKIPRLSEQVVQAVVSHFGDLQAIIDAPVEELAAVEGVGDPTGPGHQRGARPPRASSSVLERCG